MTDVTHILSAIEQGDPAAAGQLLPLVYDELRQLAAQKLAHEQPCQTLQATALVHEAYLTRGHPPRRMGVPPWRQARRAICAIFPANFRRGLGEGLGGDPVWVSTARPSRD
jgi:hypothetical protein